MDILILFKVNMSCFYKKLLSKICIVVSVLSIKLLVLVLKNSGKMLGPCMLGVFWLRLGVALIPVFLNLLVVWS